jgi:hypothetical protein
VFGKVRQPNEFKSTEKGEKKKKKKKKTQKSQKAGLLNLVSSVPLEGVSQSECNLVD